MAGKPIADNGMHCPLWRKPASKVCHTCDWYQSLTVQDPANPAVVREHWACALVLSVIAQRSMHAAVDGVQAATESFRNEMVALNDRGRRLTADETAQCCGLHRDKSMPGFLDGCIWTAAGAGVGTFTVAAAVVPYFTPANCVNPAVVDGGTYNYVAINGAEYEIAPVSIHRRAPDH